MKIYYKVCKLVAQPWPGLLLMLRVRMFPTDVSHSFLAVDELSFFLHCALATVPSRQYRSRAAAVPSRLDGTIVGEATMSSTQSCSRYR